MPPKHIKLDPQLHIRVGTLNLSRVKLVQNQVNLAKPKYGLWTSTYVNHSKHGSHFNEMFPMSGSWHLLDPAIADIFVVEDVADVHYLLKHYGRPNFLGDITYIDFEKLSEEFNALQLTQQCLVKGTPVETLILSGYTPMELNNSTFHPFHQWMGESTIWFNTSMFSGFTIIK